MRFKQQKYILAQICNKNKIKIKLKLLEGQGLGFIGLVLVESRN